MDKVEYMSKPSKGEETPSILKKRISPSLNKAEMSILKMTRILYKGEWCIFWTFNVLIWWTNCWFNLVAVEKESKLVSCLQDCVQTMFDINDCTRKLPLGSFNT